MVLDQITEIVNRNHLNVYSVAYMNADGIVEKKLNPADQTTNSYSVAKAFTVTAIGMLWDKGLISVDDKALSFFDQELPETFDEKWKEVTVEHLMKHTVGFGRGLLDIDVDDWTEYQTEDFLRKVFTEPLPYEPGTHYQYTDAAFYVLSRIVTKVSGLRLDDFLRPMLFTKLHFRELAWSVCPQGYSMGATGLYIRTADAVKLGYLYASDGVFEGERLLSHDWVSLVLEKGYELKRLGETDVFIKGGMFGQMLCALPKTHEAYAWYSHENGQKAKALLEAFQAQ